MNALSPMSRRTVPRVDPAGPPYAASARTDPTRTTARPCGLARAQHVARGERSLVLGVAPRLEPDMAPAIDGSGKEQQSPAAKMSGSLVRAMHRRRCHFDRKARSLGKCRSGRRRCRDASRPRRCRRRRGERMPPCVRDRAMPGRRAMSTPSLQGARMTSAIGSGTPRMRMRGGASTTMTGTALARAGRQLEPDEAAADDAIRAAGLRRPGAQASSRCADRRNARGPRPQRQPARLAPVARSSLA